MIRISPAVKEGLSVDWTERTALPMGARILRRVGLRIGLVGMLVTAICPSFSLAPSARADSVDALTDAVTAARAQSSCGPLRPDPVVARVTAKINQLTDDWLNHTATQIPIEDPQPGLKLLGYHGSKSTLLQGAAKTDAYAIKALLLEGRDKIPDCSYSDFGVSLLRNNASGHTLTAVVLAGA